MRTFQIGVVLFFLGLVGYAYSKDPAGCWKVVNDFGALCSSLAPVKVEIKTSSPPETPVASALPAAPVSDAPATNTVALPAAPVSDAPATNTVV